MKVKANLSRYVDIVYGQIDQNKKKFILETPSFNKFVYTAMNLIEAPLESKLILLQTDDHI